MREDDLLGKIFGTWAVFGYRMLEKDLYNCQCNKCGIVHTISKSNILSGFPCPTCPSKQNGPMMDVIELFGGLLGLDSNKKAEVATAFDKLNQPEFKEIYSSLERASASIKDVMNGKSGAPDISRKILEVEAANLKKAFNGLIEDGKISEEEARILKTEVNSSANMQKLKTMLEVMKQQQTRETPKKVKV